MLAMFWSKPGMLLEFRRVRQEYHKFEASLSNIVRLPQRKKKKGRLKM
jgi:hypothetical protein